MLPLRGLALTGKNNAEPSCSLLSENPRRGVDRQSAQAKGCWLLLKHFLMSITQESTRRLFIQFWAIEPRLFEDCKLDNKT